MDADSMAAHAEAEVSLTAEESEDQRKERVHAALHTCAPPPPVVPRLDVSCPGRPPIALN